MAFTVHRRKVLERPFWYRDQLSKGNAFDNTVDITERRTYQEPKKYVNMNTDPVQYAKTSCCPQHSETQYESRNTNAFGYENLFERVKRSSDEERIKCKGACYLKHECAFDTQNATDLRRDSAIESFDTTGKNLEDIERLLRSTNTKLLQKSVVESLTKKQQKYMEMNTNHVHTKYTKSSCCPQHCTTQYESRNTDARGYENCFERVERNSDVRRDSSIRNIDKIRKYCEDEEGYIRSRDPMSQQDMIEVENLTKDNIMIMQTANQLFKKKLLDIDKKDLRRPLYVNEKELVSSEFDDQCKKLQILDGSKNKKSKNEELQSSEFDDQCKKLQNLDGSKNKKSKNEELQSSKFDDQCKNLQNMDGSKNKKSKNEELQSSEFDDQCKNLQNMDGSKNKKSKNEELQSSEIDDQCKDPQNLKSENKKNKNEKPKKYVNMNTDPVHTKNATTRCCPQHCETQYESRNIDAFGYEHNFERVKRSSDGERIKCKGSCYLKHECAFDTENVKIKTAHVRKDSSIEKFDTIRKYCEAVEGYIRSRDPMLQQEMTVVENLTKDIMQTANQRLKEQIAEDVRRTLYVNEKEIQSTELFDDQRKDPQNLDGSEKKKSKNELLTVIPKILCSEEEHKKQNEHHEVSIDCQLCIRRNKAVNWCNTCEKNICRFCKLYHEKVWLVMDHDIQPLRIDELMCETMNVC